MKIAIVNTCDGPLHYGIKRKSAKNAAVRMLIEQLTKSGKAYDHDFDSQEETHALINRITTQKAPYKYCVEQGLIREITLIQA